MSSTLTEKEAAGSRLTEEQQMLKELCAQIAREKILPVRAEYDETGDFPWDVVKVMADSDIYGVYIPEEYGGFGGGVTEMCIATEELSKVCGGAPTRSSSSGTTSRRRSTCRRSPRARSSPPSLSPRRTRGATPAPSRRGRSFRGTSMS